MYPPQPEQADVSSRFHGVRRFRAHHRRPRRNGRSLDRRPARDRLHGRPRARGWRPRRLRDPRARHRYARAGRARPPSPGRSRGRDSPHGRFGVRARRRGRRDALAAGARAATGGDIVVGALVVVNAVGNVVDASGKILAGARGPDGAYVDALSHLAGGGTPFGAREAGTPTAAAGRNTTLAVVATNATL